MTTDKRTINRLVMICERMGLEDIVFSPGSRNAPLVVAFVESGKFNCLCIPDERVAAFFALGISLKTGKTTAICCTSGSAALNYAPAISEAYYQGVPMLILTADRPVEWIDKGIGQSIRQKNVYQNYVKASYQIEQEVQSQDKLLHNDKIYTHALQTSQTGFKGPVHINIPLAEPLYNFVDNNDEEVRLNIITGEDKVISSDRMDALLKVWQQSRRKIIILGQHHRDPILQDRLQALQDNGEVLILTETSSNVYIENAVQTIDRFITGFSDKAEQYKPDLLISLGAAVVSKKIKSYFQKYPPEYHWFISFDAAKDTYNALTEHIKQKPADFLEALGEGSFNDPAFQSRWLAGNEALKTKHDAFVSKSSWTDLKVFDFILNRLDGEHILHMGNSTVVRYIQLFDQSKLLEYHGNRGVSGIDGCSSTAMGYAYKSDKKNFLITGDIAFYYDSNAFWHKHYPKYLRIILINNEGGSIFRIIPGPNKTRQLEEFFETRQQIRANHLAAHFGMDYLVASSLTELQQHWPDFADETPGVKILEVCTPREINDHILAEYFHFLHK